MELNSRCSHLLYELSNSKDTLSIAGLATSRNISERAIQYDFSKINDWLNEYNLGNIQIKSKNVLLTTQSSQRSRIKKLLQEQREIIYTIEQRRAIELLQIAIAPISITPEKLQQSLDVSKNTILGDIREIKKTITAYGLCLSNASKRGYVLSGNETALRRLLSREICLLGATCPHSADLLKEMFNTSLALLCHQEKHDYFALVKQGVAHYEDEANTCLACENANYEILMTLLSAIRNMQGFICDVTPEEKKTLEQTTQFKALSLITKSLCEAGVRFDVEENYYLAILYLSVKNYDFHSPACPIDFLQDFTIRLINNFERAACIVFPQKDQLVNRLYLHIQPMYYRLKYGIHPANTFAQEVQSMYAWIYRYTQKALAETEGEIQQLISGEELAYLCIYMGSQLEFWEKYPSAEKRKILIVCGAGVATSVLIREQITALFGDAFHYILVPAARLQYENMNHYFLAISTIPPKNSSESSTVYTGPLLNETSKASIIDKVMQLDDFSAIIAEVENIIRLFKRHSSIEQTAAIRRELFCNLIKRNCANSQKSAPQLAELLLIEGTVFLSEAQNMSTAIKELSTSFADLQKNTNKIQLILQNQLYPNNKRSDIFWINKGIVLEYFRSDAVDLRIMVFPTQPRLFDKNPVSVIVALSTIDNSSHLPLLNNVYDIFTSKSMINQLDTLVGKNAQAISEELMKWLSWV